MWSLKILSVIYLDSQYFSSNKQVKLTHWCRDVVLFVLVVSIHFSVFIISKSTY